MEVPGSPPVARENAFGREDCADEEELVEWWQDQEEGWDSDTVLDEWDSVKTGNGFTEVHKMLFFPESADDWPLDPEGQSLIWDRHVLLQDLQGAVHQVPVQMDRDCRQFEAWCPEQLENVIFIPGATVLVRNVSLRALGVIPGMLLEMRTRLTWGAGDSHPMAALAVFRVQKYETWREYLAGSPTTAGALTRAIEQMIGRFAGDLPSLLRNVSVNCPGLEPEHMWTLLGCFETYAGALFDFSVMRYVQVRREEYHDPEDWDALQEARREYDKVKHQGRLEGANRKEHDEHLRELDTSDEGESPYEVVNVENVRKIRKQPGAPKWTVRHSKALRDYLQQPERAEEHSLANAIWEVMRKMDRQGSAYLKEEWNKQHKKEKKKRRRERKKAKKAGHKSKKGKGRKSRDTNSSSGSSSESSTSLDSSSSSQSSGKSGRQKATQLASAGRKGKWKSGSWTGGGSFGPRKVSGGSTVPTRRRCHAPSVGSGTGTTRPRPLAVGPDYGSMGGARWMRWTEGVGRSARPCSNIWMPSSESLETPGCRRQHMPWKRAPRGDTRQPSGGCVNEVRSSLGQAHAKFWSWRSRK